MSVTSKALRHRIDKRLGQFIAGRARRDLHKADRGGEQKADTDHRQHAQHAEQEWIAQALAEKAEDDRGPRQNDNEDDKPGDCARSRVLVDDRYRIEIAPRFLGHAPARESVFRHPPLR